jgi:2-polyprenyl-3-methyl-5-hydroxy-6-metoxy-1,4-benzoquinol methylase
VKNGHPDTLEFVPCAVCGAREATCLHRKVTAEGEVLSIVRCAGCGLAYVNPRRRQDKLTDMYRRSLYYQNVHEVLFGYDDYMGDRDILAIFFNHQLDTIERHVKAGGRLLDVGCATGFLLDEARRRGWQTSGVEVSEFASEYARRESKHDVLSTTLRDASYPAEHFDAVVMDDVLEHLCDPEEELREVWRILKPGGVVLIHTPNIDSPWYKLMGKHWVHLRPGEHLYYFSPSTLGRLLERMGFRIERIRPSGKTTDLEYIARRVRYYNRPLGSMIGVLPRWLPWARRPFAFRSGEMEALALKP